MYNNSYSRAKFGLEAKDIHKPKGKSCSYYVKIVFFFSSLIQSLIIVSLVLFLVYGEPEKSAEEQRVIELEQSFNRLSENNIKLRKEKGELIGSLGARTGEKAALEKEVLGLKTAANVTGTLIKGLQLKVSQCEADKKKAEMTRSTPVQCPTTPFKTPLLLNSPNGEVKTLQSLNAQQAAMIRLIEANFTQTITYMRMERDSAIKDRDTHHLDTITLRRDNTNLQDRLATYTRKCKQDFTQSLQGIQTVTTAFLTRIDNLFPHTLTFLLTCEKQQEQMDKIRTSCTSLSKEVEDKFQSYLNNVGDKVASIQAKSSSLEVQNNRMTLDLQECRHNRSVSAAEGIRLLQEGQMNHDRQVETLLKEQNRLRDEKKLQGERLALRELEVQTLTNAQANCKPAAPKPSGLQAGPPQNRQPWARDHPTGQLGS